MTEWWRERSDREKALLGAMAGACLCSLVYLAMLRPVMSYNEEAQIYYESAAALYADVSRAADELSDFSRNGVVLANRDDRPVRVLASASAREQGLSITRIQPMADDTVSFWLNNVDVRSLFAWTVDLQLEHGITVARADILRMPDKLSVQAQIVLRTSQ